MARRARRFLGSSAFLAAVAAAPLAYGGDPRVTKGPYLQDLGSTHVAIKVEVDPPAPAALELTSSRDAGGPKILENREATALHVFRVDALEPGQAYAYSLRIGGHKQPGGTFTAAPKNDADSMTFLLYGDNRSDPAAHASVVRAMRGVPSDFLVHTGDFGEDGSDPRDWQSFFDVEQMLLRDRCVFGCVGNHELIEKAGGSYLRYFGPLDPVQLYGSFRWGRARFFLLNGSDTFTDGAEAAWLRSELDRADTEAGLAWRFIVVHHGPWSAGPHGNNTRLLAGGAEQLFAAHKVDAVFSGHDHIYERGEFRGLRYVVSGGGGAPLYPVRGPLLSTKRVESAYHFVQFEVARDSVRLIARRADGSILERCGFGKAAGWDCDRPTGSPAPGPGVELTAADPARVPAPPAPTSRCGCRAVGDPSGPGRLGQMFAALALLAWSRRLRYSRPR